MKRSIIILLLGVLCLGGLLYLFLFRQESATTTIPSAETSATLNEASKSKQDESSNYLVIREWGVRMRLPEEIRGATYEYSEYEGPMFSLETIALKHESAIKIAGCSDEALISINRARPGQPIFASGATTTELKEAGHGPDRLKKIDGYYFFSENGNAPCYDLEDTPARERISKLKSYAIDAYKTLESVD